MNRDQTRIHEYEYCFMKERVVTQCTYACIQLYNFYGGY